MRLASRGLRDMDAGPEAITDTDTLNAVRRQARRVQWQSLVSAALITALYLILS
ncbi:MAG TPA: hypothetical protein VK912_10715 [Longimicrobiales bacterium]|nr:hypothetical protein [Longimicrobiales bacterium]